MNQRPSGYEPDELPGCSTPRPNRRIVAELANICASNHRVNAYSVAYKLGDCYIAQMLYAVSGILALTILTLTAFFVGPKLLSKPVVDKSDLTSQIETLGVKAYLDKKEQHLPLRAGQEKFVAWFDGEKKTEFSIVYFHGFSASHRDTFPLIPELAKTLGANVFYQRLAAHSHVNSAPFATVRWTDWLLDAEEGLLIGKKIGHKVIAVGMSTGAMLPLYINEKSDGGFDSIVMLAPNFLPKDRGAEYLSGPLGRFWARLFLGKTRRWQPLTERQPLFWTIEYPAVAIAEMMNLVNYVRHLNLAKIKVPAICVYTRADEVLSVPEMEKHCHIMNAKLHDLGPGHIHALVGEAINRQKVVPEIQDVIKQFLLTAFAGPKPQAEVSP